MTKSVLIDPPYSLLFISDPSLEDFPEQNGDRIRWTDGCVSISCLGYQENDTKVTLGPLSEVARFGAPIVERVIFTPHREVVVSTVELKVVLRATVPSTRTRVRIWENHPSEPDEIIVGLG